MSVVGDGAKEMTSVFNNFTDRKPHVVTEECVEFGKRRIAPRSWIRCAFCGRKGKVGDVYIWIYTNDGSGPAGNPFACGPCHAIDGDPKARLRELEKEWNDVVGAGRFWWFKRRWQHNE